MTPEVLKAVQDLRAVFPDATIEAEDDGQGGAYVEVEPVDLGDTYNPARTWCGFHITFQYPRSDVYPHFLGGEVRRVDNCGFGQGVTQGQWRGRQALQLSRRSNRLDPNVDTAATKLAKVVAWFRGL